jgi:hypothetical protein
MLGYIYLIYKNNDCYVGSTMNYKKRMKDHKKNYNNGLLNNKFLINLIDKYNGFDNMNHCILQTYSICDRKHLLAYEQLWINSIRIKYNCLNKNDTFGILKKYKDNIRSKQYREGHKEEISEKKRKYYEQHKEEISEKQKKYREEHKDEIIEKQMKYYEENKEKISEKCKRYYEDRKEEIKQQKKQYYEKNKEKLLVKVQCECGEILNKSSLTRHKKSKKHINNMKQLEQQQEIKSIN